MNRFGKISHHISMKDVKKKHLEEIAARKIEEIRIEEERKLHNEIYDKWKSNWRDELELEEGMTVAGSFLTVDDTILDKPVNAEKQSQIIQRGGRGSFNSTSGWNPVDQYSTGWNDGVGFVDNGTGTGEHGGFDMSPTAAELDQYLAFGFAAWKNPGGIYWPDATSQNMGLNLKDVDTISAFVIRGNGSNGGSIPPENSSGIIVQYSIPGGFDDGTIFRDVNIKPDGSDGGVSATLVPNGSGDDEFTTGKNVVFTIPSYIKYGDGWGNIRFIVRNAGYNLSPTFGVRNLTFQQRTPRNVFVSLDSPEATSFVRLGGKESDPKKRRKNVEDILRAGQQYTNNQFDNTFPGSTTTLYEPEASPKGFDQVKTQFMNDEPADEFNSIDGEKVFDNYDDARAAYDAAWQQYENDLDSAVKEFGRERYRFELKTAQSNWDSYEKTRPGGPLYPRPQFDSKRSEELANVKWLKTTTRIMPNTPAGKAIYALWDRAGELNDKFAAANNQLNAINDEQKSMDKYLASLPPNLRDQALNGTAPPDFSIEKLLASLLGGKILKAGTKMIAAGRALNKWWNKGRNERVPNESTASWKDLLKDDRAQLGKSDEFFAAGKKGNPFGRPDQAFNPFRPASKGGPGSGPTGAVRKYGGAGAAAGLGLGAAIGQGIKRVVGGVADKLTGDRYDFDKRGGQKISKSKSQNKKTKINPKNLRNNPKGEIPLPFTGKKIPTAAKRQKQVDDMFRKLQFGESRLMKPKQFFNPKDIKPEFPPEPPPQIDPKTGMHPEYGKHADRYKKLDPHSANAMPPTGEPEIDAVVKKQKTKRTFNKIKKLDKT